MDLINTLNPKQKEAVLQVEGPVMVLAGAGSGKTKALTTRVAYLIKEKKVAPWNILAVTFTNKAAAEMKERIKNYSQTDEKFLNVFTFHSFCARMLRWEAETFKIKNFVIYDDGDCASVIREVIKKHNKQADKEFSISAISEYIDHLKNNSYFVGAPKIEIADEYLRDHPFYPLYLEYESELKRCNALDFGGLIIKTIEMLYQYPETLQKYQEKFKYILIDEYQDTNRTQFDLINLLAMKYRNLCIVLDLDQSIYSFRSANINNTLDFEKIYPEHKLIKLEQNYRSTQNILNAANNVIGFNKFRKDKNLYTQNEAGELLQVTYCANQNREAQMIALKVEHLIRGKIPAKEIAIFFRNNAQSRAIEEQLRQRKINYMLYGGMKFYERKEIKDLLSYLKLLVNLNDDYAFLRIINSPTRGIGSTSLDKIKLLANQEKISLIEAANKISLPKKTKESISKFIQYIIEIKSKIGLVSLTSLFDELMEKSEYLSTLEQSKSYEDQARVENIKEFRTSLLERDSNKTTLEEYLEEISLNIDKSDIDIESCISMMSIHAAKGLEFDYVFITGLEEDIFPSYQSKQVLDKKNGVEEERRLFYVAVTRARKMLWITYVGERLLYGQIKRSRRSRFLDELPANLIHETMYLQGM